MQEQRKLAAIMFTDIVGYTALMPKDEQKAHQILIDQKDSGMQQLIKPDSMNRKKGTELLVMKIQ